MTTERFPPARLTAAQLLDLPEYSTTLPTGTGQGKRWRRASRPWLNDPSDEWWMGQYGKPYPEGHEHHGSVPIFWRRIIVLGVARKWPVEVPVPLRLVDGPRDAPEGIEEGALCCRPLRDGGHCLARLELRSADDLGGCACFISAPCGSCMSQVPECPGCGHREPGPA